MKALVNLMCCVVPRKSWRKTLRHRLVDVQRRRKDLVERGFSIDGDVVTTPEGVRIDISHTADYPLYLIKEVFIKSEYNLILRADSVLIDIGMNRGAVSLRFAANEHIKKVYSYEPFGPTFEMAQKNLRLNPQLSEKIIANNFGLGRADVELELPYRDCATGAMSTTYNTDVNEGSRTERVVVKEAAKVLGPILSEHAGRHVIVKCDCEGAEYEIFENLNEQGLVGGIDVVMMEYHFDGPDKLVDILTENGFALQVKVGSSKSRTGYIYGVRMAEKAHC